MAAVELDPAKLRQELAELAEKRGEVILCDARTCASSISLLPPPCMHSDPHDPRPGRPLRTSPCRERHC